jgi:hypothetical protein
MEVSCELHATATLPPRKSPLCPLVRRLSGPPGRSGRGEERHVCLCRESNPDSPAPSLLTILTELRAMNSPMLEAASTSETSLNFCQTARENIPEDSHPQQNLVP